MRGSAPTPIRSCALTYGGPISLAGQRGPDGAGGAQCLLHALPAGREGRGGDRRRDGGPQLDRLPAGGEPHARPERHHAAPLRPLMDGAWGGSVSQ